MKLLFTKEWLQKWMSEDSPECPSCPGCGAMAGCCSKYPNCPGNPNFKGVENGKLDDKH